MSSKRTWPRSTFSAGAFSRSTTVIGCTTVCMPSWTMPMFSKMPLTTHMIQPAMLLMRMTSAVARAMAPTLIWPMLHNHRARPVVPAISTPFMLMMQMSIPLTIRDCWRKRSITSPIAVRA